LSEAKGMDIKMKNKVIIIKVKESSSSIINLAKKSLQQCSEKYYNFNDFDKTILKESAEKFINKSTYYFNNS